MVSQEDRDKAKLSIQSICLSLKVLRDIVDITDDEERLKMIKVDLMVIDNRVTDATC